MLRQILLSALITGVAAGLTLTGVQQIEVVPIILEAESYEGNDHHHESHDHPSAHGDHGDHGEWTPADGLERHAWTAVANIGVGFGFALLLCAAYAWRGGVQSRHGVLWGLAGFVIFFVNPGFGLPPEIPGAAAAALEARQAWWLATVTCTALGLGLIAFRHEHWAAIAGAALCFLPHAIGVPHPEHPGGSAPLALAQAFVGAAYLANAVFWLVLGAVSAWTFNAWSNPLTESSQNLA